MICQRCGLPDSYRGDGDGIGSCDCMRCQCCSAAPYDCECGRDWDPIYDDEDTDGFDYLCNDTSCERRRWRMERQRVRGDRGAAIEALAATSEEERTDG